MDLRDYQEDLVFGQLYSKLSDGIQRVVAVAPTGSGKTIMACQTISDLVAEDCTVMFVCHLDQLVIQTADKLTKYGISSDQIGFITGGRPEHRNRPIQIASVQSLPRRAWWKDRFWGAVILDECHLTAYRKACEHFFSAAHEGLTIGLTATPYRLKKHEGLSSHFDAIVQAPTPAALTDMGHLSPLRYWGFGKAGAINTQGVKTRAGDFAIGDLEQACARPELLNHAVNQWQKLAAGKKTLCFCTTVKHAEALRDEFIRHGVAALLVCGETPRDERQEIYRKLEDGEIDVVTSVDVLAIGFDLPCAEALLLARPTKSRAIHLQQLGRGARPLPGKEFCCVLDQAGNVLKHGFLTDDGPWSLDIPEEKGEGGDAPVKVCDPDDGGCGAVVHASLMVCPDCGRPFPVKKKKSRTDDLKELTPKPKLCAKTKKMHVLLGNAHRKGYLPNWAVMEFEKNFGHHPSGQHYRHALVERPHPEALEQYAKYLAVLCRKKDRPWALAVTCLTREFGPEFMEGRIAHAREVWQVAFQDESLELEDLAFGPRRVTGPREGSVTHEVLTTLKDMAPEPLTTRGIASAIGSRRQKMSPKKLIQLEDTVGRSVNRLKASGLIFVVERRSNGHGGQLENLYQAAPHA